MAPKTKPVADDTAYEADEFLDGIVPNEFISKQDLAELGEFRIVDVSSRHSQRFNRDEYIFELDVVGDAGGTNKLISFGKDNSYIQAFVNKFQEWQKSGRDMGGFILKEIERNRFRFARAE